MKADDFERRKAEVLQELRVTAEEQEQLQKRTTDQAECEEWKIQRRSRVTASHNGTILKRSPKLGYATVVKALLYPKPFSNRAVNWGKAKEREAIREYENSKNVKGAKCGLFVDIDNGFLGSSPDGLVGTEGIIQVNVHTAPKALNLSRLHRNLQVSAPKKYRIPSIEIKP